MAIILLIAAILLSLFLVPIGLPGTWLMIGAAIAFDYLSPTGRVGWIAIGVALVLAFVAEVFEWTLASRYAQKYGGSKRAGWGAFIGGLIGAFVGFPIPVLGSMVGAFAGAFAGALVAEYTNRNSTAGTATRVATGALLGRAAATAMKMAIAFVIAVVLVGAAWI
jgi:uncharacterized protein YqgC (DUF456 family)